MKRREPKPQRLVAVVVPLWWLVVVLVVMVLGTLFRGVVLLGSWLGIS